MRKTENQIARLKAAFEALEDQRSTLGDIAVDLSQKALKDQIKDLEKGAGSETRSKGERLQATILFTDLSGYTAMNEKLDPEEVQELMNKIKTESIRIVEHHGGSVNQFVGDEVLALFGIPNAHEDDPVRAVNAALDLHEFVNDMSKEVEPLIGKPLTMHSGINTGLIITNVFDQRDGIIGVIGDTVNTGARLLSKAKEDEILVSPQTHRLIEPYFETKALNPVEMKGKVEPMIPYSVLGRTNISTRIEAAEQRGFTKFMGRDSEVAILNSCLERAGKGEGQFVTIAGGAGLGKSRLIHEFLEGLNQSEYTILEGRCQSFGSFAPYLPFLDAIRRELSFNEKDTLEQLHKKVTESFTAMGLIHQLPVILHLLSIPSTRFPLPVGISGEKLRRSIQEALVELNTRNAKKMTKVWILEDWHWSDKASEDTLHRHLEVMSSLQIMIVVLYRPRYKPKWEKFPFHTEIDLGAVNKETVEALVEAIYHVSKVPPGFSDHIFQHSAGNPFFIEELCQYFKEEKIILLEGGTITLQNPIDEITFPETVQAVIRTKLDRLIVDSKEVISLASVLGCEFLVPILEEMTHRKEELPTSLERLEGTELIRLIENTMEMTYQFNHVITQEVAYERILKKQRRVLHQMVGETIEFLYKERLEEKYEFLAHHYSMSKAHDKAIKYLVLAGDKAARNYSLVEARNYYLKAMSLIDDKETTVEEKRTRLKISLRWAQISHFSAPEDLATTVLKTSRSYATELGDEVKLAHISHWLGQKAVMTGKLLKAIKHFTKSMEKAVSSGEGALLERTYAAIGRVHLFNADYDKSNEYLLKAVDLSDDSSAPDDKAGSASVLGPAFSFIGEFDKAHAHGLAAISFTKESGNLSLESISHMWLGLLHWVKGDWQKSIEDSETAIAIAQPLGDIIPIILGTSLAGFAHCMIGEREKGLAMLDKCIRQMELNKFFLFYPILYAFRALALGRLGMLEEAKLAANNCLEWNEKGWRGFEGLANYTLARVESKQANPDMKLVDELMERGMALCEKRGQRPFQALGYFEYAHIRLARKDVEGAKINLGEAVELFKEMKMEWWLEVAEDFRKRLGD